ncbi:hypothetical protein [Neisseria sp. CCUG12390]|uniref:hypothetical protein n=1 Tax=Neisseria sp. CCUG12390 TaxID=3392035 RepID=UPI003A0FD647
MKKLLTVSFLAFATLALTGCVAASIPTGNYVAQSYTKAEGNALLGEFSYLPGEYGRVQPNQIQNKAIGPILLDDNVENLVRQATALELRQSGINVGNGHLRLDGTVEEFLADDVGYNVDWRYRINYRLINLKNHTTLLNRDYTVSLRTPKLAASLSDIAPRINKPIAQGFKQFIEDPEVQRIFKENQ